MRTTATAVRNLAKISEEVDVLPYMEIANELVTEIAGCSKLNDTRLELIERNLAAHYAFMSGITTAASVTSKSIGGASTSFSRTGRSTGLEGSPYGEAARMLDPSGCLLRAINGAPTITWLGTPRT